MTIWGPSCALKLEIGGGVETLHCVFMFPLYSLGLLNFDIDTVANTQFSKNILMLEVMWGSWRKQSEVTVCSLSSTVPANAPESCQQQNKSYNRTDGSQLTVKIYWRGDPEVHFNMSSWCYHSVICESSSSSCDVSDVWLWRGCKTQTQSQREHCAVVTMPVP